MVRSYIRHGPTQAFGLVCSPGANSIYDGKHAYVPALEDVLVWDVKKGVMKSMWHETGHRAEVTFILKSPKPNVVAVGYIDGSLRLWDTTSGAVIVTFNGHKKAITALAFDAQGSRIASGSQDTDIILWDIEAESGLYRLRGHRDQITALRFLAPTSSASTSTTVAPGHLISTSKDTFMKLWDLTTHHCIQTLVAHRSDVWSLDVDSSGELILTGSGDGELKAWSLDTEALADGLKENENGELPKILHNVGSLPLASTHRVSAISFHPTQSYLAVQSHDRSVEIFRIRSEEEVRKKRARRQKRSKEKKKGKGATVEDEDAPIAVNGNSIEGIDEKVELVDLFTPYLVIRASGKIRSFDFVNSEVTAKGGVHILTALSNNALEIYNIPPPNKSKEESPEATRVHSMDLPGHRTDVRTLCLSSNDQLLASGSNGSLKLWNMKTNACIRTLECGYAICSTFIPGDRQVLMGTKEGDLLLFDLASSSLIEKTKAHEGAVWSLHIRPNKTGFVTGSADKDVKFWDFDYTSEGANERDKPSVALVHKRTLKMTDDVLAVRFSPDGKFLAVALLDSTVKVFFQDTLKFFLSLYGHKLPVLSMDISFDSKLIVTCSADKNVKIWGLDFGDCHRSIFAHDDSIMQVAFEHKSHYFWTVSKDRFLKYWDGDKFEGIQKLDGHHGEIWALAVSHQGNFVVTGSHDKSIRVWEKTDEPLFLEEERERELEELHEKGITDSMTRNDDDQDREVEATAVNKQTSQTLMAGERIMEALEIADTDREANREYEDTKAKLPNSEAAKLPPPTQHAVLAAYELDGPAYVLRVVQSVASTALNDALLVLPFSKVISLMHYLNEWAQRDMNIVLTSRILFFLLKIHYHQVVANRTMRAILVDLRFNLRGTLKRQKDEIGYNLAALHYIKQQHDADRTAQFYEQDMDEEQVRAKITEGKKRKRVNVRA